jgi:UDP-perosamine 4-acetyltransferase
MIAIIGAGGHAKAVYECLFTSGKAIFGLYDNDPEKIGQDIINGCKVLGLPEDVLGEPAIDEIYVAIGDNRVRLEKYTWFRKKGYALPSAIHARAHISPFCHIGEGLFMMGAAIVNPHAVVGDYCIVNTNATVGHDCRLGDAVQLGPGTSLGGGCVLEEGVFMGIGCRVVPGVRIGKWSVVGAGSLVLNDLPAGSFFHS